jgi:hypothetical protein
MSEILIITSAWTTYQKKPGQVWLCVVNYGNFSGGRGDEKNYGR